jgi:hypothetical protein
VKKPVMLILATLVMGPVLAFLLWSFSLPSVWIGDHCSRDQIRSGIDRIAQGAGLDQTAIEELGLGTASSGGDKDCFLAVIAGYDRTYVYNPVKDCWRFGWWMLTALPKC